MNTESMLNGTRYALRQLRDFRCIHRAIDALERIEEGLAAGVGRTIVDDEGNETIMVNFDRGAPEGSFSVLSGKCPTCGTQIIHCGHCCANYASGTTHICREGPRCMVKTPGERAIDALERIEEGLMARPDRFELWKAVNEYAAACGGDTSNNTISDRRIDAVAAVDRAAGCSTPAMAELRPTCCVCHQECDRFSAGECIHEECEDATGGGAPEDN